MKRIATALFLIMCSTAIAQTYEYYYFDYTYKDYIKTVRLNPAGLPMAMPIIPLDKGRLLLEFDDLEADVKNYTYQIEPCMADWSPATLLTPLDWLDGFEEDILRDFQNSFNSNTKYVHWRLELPNGNMRIKRSGNYLLKVFVEGPHGKEVAITRRFMVNEQAIGVRVRQSYPADAGKQYTHQELDFEFGHKGFRIANPLIEVTATVLQNARWDTAIEVIRPNAVMPDLVMFDYQNQIVFPGGREWRWFDTRSVRFKSGYVSTIDVDENDVFNFYLRPDQDRYDMVYLFDRDVNGDFVIENRDFRNSNGAIESDYVKVHFALKVDKPFEREDVYVAGAMTEWLTKPQWKMEYNPKTKMYHLESIVKQGFYNYAYVLKERAKRPDWESLEGNWHETNNTYTILIYFLPFGQQSHRLIGATTYDSTRF